MVYICSNLMDGISLFRCLLFSVLSVLSRKPSSGRVTGGGYIFFYHSVSTMISGYMPVYLVTNKQDVPAVFSTTCRVIALDSILNF